MPDDSVPRSTSLPLQPTIKMESVFRSLASRESRSSASHGVRQSVLGSSHLAERFSRRPVLLEGHTGCVNSIQFSECGSQIITASDDLNINFWDLSGEMINHMPTIHSNNVFCAKDLPTSSSNEIISCAADGQVVLSNVSQSKVRILNFNTPRQKNALKCVVMFRCDFNYAASAALQA